MKVHVSYHHQRQTLTYVLEQNGPSLFGRDWLSILQLNWKFIKWTTSNTTDPEVEAMLSKYSEVFKDELGTIKGYTAKLQIEENASPKFCRPRPVPFALKPKVDEGINRLIKGGIQTNIFHTSWASPIVVVPKKDCQVRLCGDYKVSINRCLKVDQHPLPSPEELFSTLSEGQQFSTLDLSQAYQQLLMEPSSSEYTTINTHRGSTHECHLV